MKEGKENGGMGKRGRETGKQGGGGRETYHDTEERGKEPDEQWRQEGTREGGRGVGGARGHTQGKGGKGGYTLFTVLKSCKSVPSKEHLRGLCCAQD